MKNKEEFTEQTEAWAARALSAELMVFAKDGGLEHLGTRWP